MTTLETFFFVFLAVVVACAVWAAAHDRDGTW